MSFPSNFKERILLLLVVLFPFYSVFSQTKEEIKNQIIEDRIEYLVESEEEPNIDYTTFFDHLSFYYDHPLNLNKVELDELQGLDLLSDIQINNLLDHIEKTGKLIALEELQTIKGFNKNTIQLILPFVKVSDEALLTRVSLKELVKNGSSQLFFRYQEVLEKKKGFTDINDSLLTQNPNARYAGNSSKLYTRYRYNYGPYLSIGFTAEKDAGEQFFAGTQKSGFDFYSAHLFLKNQGKLKQLAIGDYQVQFGQGLTYWSGIAFGKSSNVMLIKKSALGLKAYTSVDENRFMRGAGATVQWGKVELTTFYSHHNIDANISRLDSINGEVLSVTSLQQTGYHRTINELEDRHAIGQEDKGARLAYKTRKLNVGVIGVQSKLDADFQPSLNPYSQFRNSDNTQTNLGLDYTWVYKNVNFFGEFSQSVGAGKAFLSGALVALDPKLSISILYRDYDRDFQPISSAAIGENSTNSNEKGLYLGLEAKPIKKYTLSAYYDQFTFPWLKFQVNSPSKGYQYLTQLTYTPSKKLEMYIRIRERSRGKNTREEIDGIDCIALEKQINYRYNVVYQVSDAIKLKTRVEFVNYQLEQDKETGFLIYQDVIFKSLKSPFSFAFRYGIFDTKSYNSRIYSYENDVLYAYSIPAYFNRGTRTYLTIRYRINKGLDVWMRYGVTYYDNVSQISSGLEEIQGNTKSEIKAQLRFKF